MDTITIHYHFHLGAHGDETIELQLDKHSLESIKQLEHVLPEWTQLEFHKCPHCPLNPQEHLVCPAAANISHVVGRFDNVASYDQIDLEVITDARRVSQHTTAQKGISSLLGLLFATSGCPHTNFMKPMARFHLPLATEEDTIYRAAGMYLLAQYFIRQENQSGNLELSGLAKIYQNLHLVNNNIARRIKAIAQTDSSVNAVIILDTFANIMPFVIEDQLDEIRHLFSAYLSDLEQP